MCTYCPTIQTLQDGQVQAFRITADGHPEETTISPNQLPPGQPPVLRIKADDVSLPVAITDAASLLTPVAILPMTDRLVSLQAGVVL